MTRPRNETKNLDTSTTAQGAANDDTDTAELDLGLPPENDGQNNSVGMLVAAYVDAVTASGGRPSTAMKKAIGANVKRLLREDPEIELPVILRAVQLAGAKRQRTVDPFLGDVQVSYGRDATRKAMFAAWEQHAARFDGRQP